jgi:voltage-dependent calcium channel N type alpha-1B
MYTAINSKGGRENGGLVYCFYFVMLTLCGDYTLLNVFLAIACDSLDQAAALTEAEEAEKEVRFFCQKSLKSAKNCQKIPKISQNGPKYQNTRNSQGLLEKWTVWVGSFKVYIRTV